MFKRRPHHMDNSASGGATWRIRFKNSANNATMAADAETFYRISGQLDYCAYPRKV